MIPTPKRSIITNKSLKHARHVQAQWKITGACIKLLPNRGWNQKQKHKKTALEQRGMLRIWRRDCALCVIGNVFPCRQPHNHSATLLRGHSTLVPRIKTARRFTAKNPDDKMISKGGCVFPWKKLTHKNVLLWVLQKNWCPRTMTCLLYTSPSPRDA